MWRMEHVGVCNQNRHKHLYLLSSFDFFCRRMLKFSLFFIVEIIMIEELLMYSVVSIETSKTCSTTNRWEEEASINYEKQQKMVKMRTSFQHNHLIELQLSKLILFYLVTHKVEFDSKVKHCQNYIFKLYLSKSTTQHQNALLPWHIGIPIWTSLAFIVSSSCRPSLVNFWALILSRLLLVIVILPFHLNSSLSIYPI